jgi:site-specific DNA-methyltransferase (adenine-specific)
MDNSLINTDGIIGVRNLVADSIHLILSDIPYGIGADKWDVLHANKNSALLGASPAQIQAGAVFRHRGKPLNGWSVADRLIPWEYQKWCESFAGEWFRILKPGGSAMVFAGRRLSPRCVVAFENAGFTFKDSLAWIREKAPHRAQRLSKVFCRRGDAENSSKYEGWKIGNLRPLYEPILWFVKPYQIGTTIADNMLVHGVGGLNESAFLEYETSPDNILKSRFAKGEAGLHSAQKPVRLLQSLIDLTTLPGQVVLDPFCGSGSTLEAARLLGRNYIGFEDDVVSFDIAKRRLCNR